MGVLCWAAMVDHSQPVGIGKQESRTRMIRSRKAIGDYAVVDHQDGRLTLRTG